MSPTREEEICLLQARIEEWDRSLNRWADTSMPAYQRTIKLKQEAQAALDRLLRMSQEREGTERKPTNLADRAKVRIGRNVDKLRKECGWSLDVLADKTGIDKKAILSHVHGKWKPHPKTMKEYAQAFSKALGREITAPDLEN